MRTVEQIREEMMLLSDDDRLVLAAELVASVPVDADYEASWLAEIQERSDDFDAGRVQGIDDAEIFSDLRKNIGDTHHFSPVGES